MKKILLLFLSLYGIINLLAAQNLADTTLGGMKLNFAVPDMPAFKVLGTDPSNLLRPSTPKAVALTMSSFNENGKLILPRAFALEISPALLLNSHKGPQQLIQYSKNAVLNSFRISIGSSSDTLLSTSGRSLAIGLRISLINEGDFGTDTEAQKEIAKALRTFRTKSVASEKAFAISIDALAEYKDDPDLFIESHLAAYNKFLATPEEPNQEEFLDRVKQLKEDYRKKHWNDEKLDLAISVLSSSPDSIVKNLRFNQAQLWLTWAHKLGKSNKAQLLAGINAQVTKNLLDTSKTRQSNSYFNLSVPVRLLFGSNRIKGYGEGQYQYNGQLKESSLQLSLGTEINIIDGVWANLYGGFSYSSKTSGTKTIVNFNLKFTLPENFKFF